MRVFTSQKKKSVSALGETRLIALIREWLGDVSLPSPRGIGDDCAVLSSSRSAQVITVDPVVYGRHFDDQVPAEAVGAKLLKRNLSDLAAMGAKPTVAVIALILAPQTNWIWLEGFYRGLAAAARIYRVKIVGGDVAQSEAGFAASLTLLGRASGNRILTRRGAARGDSIYVTGELGGSLLGHHFTFTPRLVEGVWLARRSEVHSLMDLSDGLAKDVHSLAPANARAALFPEKIPISEDAFRLAKKTGRDAIEHALTDGEDYELVFTLDRAASPTRFEKAWRQRFKTRLTLIGKFVGKNEPTGDEIVLEALHGYEHLR